MWINAEHFYKFYQTSLGLSVTKNINRILNELWSHVDHQFILGIGYAHPYMHQFTGRSNRIAIAMLNEQGAVAWPSNNNNATLLVDESNLPFVTESFDKLLMVHSFEFSESRNQLLIEAWRLLKPRGELILIVPNKGSIWSKSVNSPFGYGNAYFSYQVESLLNNYSFLKIRVKKALFYPPLENKSLIRIVENIENLNSLYFNKFGGVIIFKVTKQLYGLTSAIKHEWLPRIFKPSPAL